MAELKTKVNKGNVRKFLNKVSPKERRKDSFELLKIFSEVTKEKPRMWGESIVGFGKYHYKSKKSTQEGDWFLAGFSPRKNVFSLYLMSGFSGYEKLLKKLGKFKKSSGCCLYIEKLEDINLEVLKRLIKESIRDVKNGQGIGNN